MKKGRSDALRLIVLAILLLSICPFAATSLQKANAEALGSWTSTTAYGQAISNPGCVTASISGQSYIYCIGGVITGGSQTQSGFYAPISSTGIGSWTAITNSLPSSPANGVVACVTDVISGIPYIFCIWDDFGTNKLQEGVAVLSAGGIGSWTSARWNNGGGTAITGTGGILLACSEYADTIFCLGMAQTTTYYASLSSGGVGNWNTGTAFPASAQFGITTQCPILAGFIYCVDPMEAAAETTHVRVASVSSSGFGGSWSLTTAYPISDSTHSCVVLQSYIYCVSGDSSNTATNKVYYNKATSGTLGGSWTLTALYPTTGGGQGCIADPTDFFIYCLGNGVAPSAAAYYSQANGLGIFTCVITNMDGGNYLIAGNSKAYDFQCEVQSNAFSGPNFPINDVRVTFNDSVHTIILDYNNATVNGPVGYSILQGNSFVTLGSGTVIQSLNGAGVRTLIVNFLISLTSSIVDANNRGIQLYAKNYGFIGNTVGPLYVQTNYFNIVNKGGATTIISSGLCSVPKGADTFQTECKYQMSPTSSIKENVTYFDLQAFQMQDAIKLSDGSTAQQGDALLWQNYANSGAGANNSTNPGDWTITYALYYWDNSTWVKGINAEISTLFGRQGTNNEWTAFNVEWRNGATFIKNDTIVDYIQQTPLGEATIYCNLWFSNNNQSTVQGGQVSNFYTGMHNVGYLWWSSWSPLLQNETQSEAFAPLLDHTGKLASATTLTLAKVGYVMARPGPSGVHAKQPNFYIDTLPYQAQTFQIASGSMGGITNPSFNAAVVPIIQNTGFFSPIVNALRSLANWFISGLSSVAQAIWASLAVQFPWMTNWLTLIYNTILGFYQFLFTVFAYVVEFVRFLYSIVSLVVYPITVIIGAWTYIQGIYLPIFNGANLTAMVEIAILWIFAGCIIDASERNDPAAYWKLATSAWHITKAVFDVTWMIAKFIVDSLEGLIP